MEILSPAGNLKHIDVAIEKKVDAVYGGLREWNARSKAVNFSIEEYNEVIKRLHSKNIKFYLTLNTLVLDEEIKGIIDFLEMPSTELPDAFIITDIGLITILKNKFPNVPLHFSTQFGIHNVADCKFAESLGAERAILARELTYEEINNIRNNSKLELETFVWGSQCMSFSGLCFFGSLLNCGNGNRGKCIITCRDVYKVNNSSGHFLYIPDLDCTKMIDKLEEINVDCIKLEGRRRNPKELKTIIDSIKSHEYSENQNGYIYGENVNKNKLYEKINRRIKPVYNIKELKNISKYDVFMRYTNGIPEEIISENLEKYNSDEVYYVYSEYEREFDFDKRNISIDLEISENIITSALYVNPDGTGKILDCFKEEKYNDFNLDKFVNEINSLNSEINLYKVKYKRNIGNDYKIGEKFYKSIINYIKNDNVEIQKSANKVNPNFKINDLVVETDKLDYAMKLRDIKLIKVIYNIATVEELQNVANIIEKLGDKVIYKLPLFNFKSIDLKQYYDMLADKIVMFTRPSQIYETKDIKFKRKYVDYTVYVWNKETVRFLEKYKIDEFTATPELSYERNKDILKGKKVQYIVAGRLPLVYTRQCFSHLYNCQNCSKNMSEVKSLYNIDKNIEFKVICKKDYRMIVADKPILNDYQYMDDYDNISFRYVTTNQTFEEITKTIEILKEKDYYEKLKQTKIWKNSYKGNIKF